MRSCGKPISASTSPRSSRSPGRIILAFTGESVMLDGSRSWSRSGEIASLRLVFHGRDHGVGASRVERTYDQPGQYSEILKVSDDRGNVAYDFAVVEVIDRADPEPVPPAIHAAYFPTFNLHPATRSPSRCGHFPPPTVKRPGTSATAHRQ